MTAPDELLAPIRARAEAYASQGTPGLHAPQDRARLLVALGVVPTLHRKSPIYDTWVEDCEHNFECDGVEGSDGYSYCPEGIGGYTCAECAEYNPNDELPAWPCPTVTAVTTALEGQG